MHGKVSHSIGVSNVEMIIHSPYQKCAVVECFMVYTQTILFITR